MTRRKWRIKRTMLVPATWQGTPEHFYHFFLGYFMPAVLWQERSRVREVTVRDCGPMNPWFDLMRPGTSVDFMPPGVMLERLLSHRQERVILHDWDNPTRFHRRSLDLFVLAVSARVTGSEADSAGREPHITVLDRRAGLEYYTSQADEVSDSGGERRSIPNIDHVADRLSALGSVTVLDTASLSPAEQVRAMRRTDLLVAQHGAGLANMVWLPSGSSVVEISPSLPPTIDTIFANLAAARQLGYRAVPQPGTHAPVEETAVLASALALLDSPTAFVPPMPGRLPIRLVRQLPRRL